MRILLFRLLTMLSIAVLATVAPASKSQAESIDSVELCGSDSVSAWIELGSGTEAKEYRSDLWHDLQKPALKGKIFAACMMKSSGKIVRYPIPDSVKSCEQNSIRLACRLDSDTATVATSITQCMSTSLDVIMNTVELNARDLSRTKGATDNNAYLMALLLQGGFQVIFKTIKDTCATPYGDNFKFAQDVSTILFWSKLAPLEDGLNAVCEDGLSYDSIHEELDKLCIKYVNTTFTMKKAAQ